MHTRATRKWNTTSGVPEWPLPKEELAKLPRHIAQAYFWAWQADIKWRCRLIDFAEAEFKRDNLKLAARFMRMATYLADRAAYIRNPPTGPDQWPVSPGPVEP